MSNKLFPSTAQYLHHSGIPHNYVCFAVHTYCKIHEKNSIEFTNLSHFWRSKKLYSLKNSLPYGIYTGRLQMAAYISSWQADNQL